MQLINSHDTESSVVKPRRTLNVRSSILSSTNCRIHETKQKPLHCWVMLQNGDMLDNTEFFAVQLPCVSLTFYSVDEMLIWNSVFLAYISFTFQMLQRVLFSRFKLRFYFFSRLIAYRSYTQICSFSPSNLSYFLYLVFPFP